MTPNDARLHAHNLRSLIRYLKEGHLEPRDVEYVAGALVEVLEHIAEAGEARERNPMKDGSNLRPIEQA